MKKTNISKFIKGLLLSVSALIVGFCAISFPFHLFDTLTSREMRIIFISEIVIYFVTAMIFLLIRESKQEKRQKKQQKRESLEKQQINFQEIIDSYNIAA
ncbi:MAG: hypothetical protein ACI4IE_02320 [Eubacterium sp.]